MKLQSTKIHFRYFYCQFFSIPEVNYQSRMDNFRFSTVMLQKIFPKTILTWDPIFKGLVSTLQVRYWLEICCHGHAVKTLFNEAYAKFDSSLLSYFSIFQKAIADHSFKYVALYTRQNKKRNT